MGMCRRWLCLACLAKYLSFFFFVLVQMSLEPCLIKHSGRWMGAGTASFLSLSSQCLSSTTSTWLRPGYRIVLQRVSETQSSLCFVMPPSPPAQLGSADPLQALCAEARHPIIKSDAFECTTVGVIGVAGRNGWP